MTILLTAALLILAVAGAELVRSTCRRQLTAPITPRLATPQSVTALAAESSVVGD